jgi:serine/threonine-protein kinase
VTNADSTAAFESPGGPQPASSATGVPTPGRGFDEEFRRLLRSRLILVHVLAFAYIALLAALSLAIPDPGQDRSLRPDQGSPWWLAAPLGESLAGAFVLWRLPGMTLPALRLWELLFFATHAAYNAMLRYAMLANVAGGSPDPPGMAVAFSGMASLSGFVTLILAYGVLIPNTPRRSLLLVGALTAVPFGSAAAAAASNPALRGVHLTPIFIQAAGTLVFPAGIAVFAATRATALQRRAFEAERRAERVGNYALKRKLGEGGMGEVWLAEHGLLKRPCAVKFIRAGLAAHPATAARFAREVQAVTGLTHVNTVRVYDYGLADDGSLYYVMEYLEGPTLEELVDRAGPLPPGRVVYLLRQVCGALAEAHAAGLVHRDLKPGNVMVTSLGGQRDVAKLLDFGLVQDLAAEADDRLTGAGTVLGTPAYMSPEQSAGEPSSDARVDLYSLGAVAFFALAGRPPFQAGTAGQVLAAHRSEPPPPLADLRPDVPEDLAAIVARCLAKQADDRFPSAAELDRALARCLCASDWSAERASTDGDRTAMS